MGTGEMYFVLKFSCWDRIPKFLEVSQAYFYLRKEFEAISSNSYPVGFHGWSVMHIGDEVL
jgi:hypothetical protein